MCETIFEKLTQKWHFRPNFSYFLKSIGYRFTQKNLSNRFDRWSKSLFDTEYEYFSEKLFRYYSNSGKTYSIFYSIVVLFDSHYSDTNLSLDSSAFHFHFFRITADKPLIESSDVT